MINQEHQVRIVLDTLITKLSTTPIPCLDAEVIALFTVFKGYNLRDLENRYNLITSDEYVAKIHSNEVQYSLYLEYALRAIENSKKEHYKIHSS